MKTAYSIRSRRVNSRLCRRFTNDAFEKNSWYFRNALVRANYTNLQKGVHSTTKFLEMFFGNLLLGTEHELKNRYMHIDYVEESHPQSAKQQIPKCQTANSKVPIWHFGLHFRRIGCVGFNKEKSNHQAAGACRHHRQINQKCKANYEVAAR